MQYSTGTIVHIEGIINKIGNVDVYDNQGVLQYVLSRSAINIVKVQRNPKIGDIVSIHGLAYAGRTFVLIGIDNGKAWVRDITSGVRTSIDLSYTHFLRESQPESA